jgi:hypothetical protein
MTNEETNRMLAIGAAAVAAVVGLVAIFGNDTAAEQPGPIQRAATSVQEAVTSSSSSGGMSIPNPFQADYAGMLDSGLGSLDEDVGGTIQDAADSLGSGPGELVDSLASESVGQSAVRSLFPGVAAAETAAQAGDDVVDGITDGGSSSSGSSGDPTGRTTDPYDPGGSQTTTESEQEVQDAIDQSDSWDSVDTDYSSSPDSDADGADYVDRHDVDDSSDWSGGSTDDASSNRDSGESTSDYADRLGF